MLRILVTYDISEDNLRHKISECCLDYGLDRQQYSVFTGELKPIHIRALAKAIRPFVKNGQVLIILLSSDDWDKRIALEGNTNHGG